MSTYHRCDRCKAEIAGERVIVEQPLWIEDNSWLKFSSQPHNTTKSDLCNKCVASLRAWWTPVFLGEKDSK